MANLVTFHYAFVFSHCNFLLFIRLNKGTEYQRKIGLAQMREKNRTGPNELDELKYSESLTQIISYVHWHALLHAQTSIKIFVCLIWNIKRINILLEYSKTPPRMSSYAHKNVFMYLHAQTSIHFLIDLKQNHKRLEKYNLNFLFKKNL